MMKYLRGSIIASGNNTPGTLDPGIKLAATLCHLASGAKYSDMQYSLQVAGNTLSLYVVVREICHAICEEYVDEVMTAASSSEE